MPWFKVDDALAFHMKALTAGNQALGLWVRAGSWSMQQLSDGFVPASIVTALGGTHKDARSLMQAGLWHQVDGGFQFHDWAEYQPTRDSVIAEREAAAERMREVRANKRKRSGEHKPNVQGTFADGSASPSRPVPSPDLTKTSESQSLRDGAIDSTDSIIGKLAAQAGLDLHRIIDRAAELGVHIDESVAFRFGQETLAKAKRHPTKPTAYVMATFTQSPHECEKRLWEMVA